MKQTICMLLAALLALSVPAMAAAQLGEATMIYEDYDGNHSDWTVSDDDELQELVDMLQRAKGNPATPENCTMNCTLMCKTESEKVVAFEVATNGSPYITEMNSGRTYRLSDDDWARLWQIFDQVQEVMGYDAADVLNW